MTKWGEGRQRVVGREFLVALTIVTLTGCAAVGPDYQPPGAELPDMWEQELSNGLAEGKADLRTWWTALDAPMLDELIARATAGNLDLKQAVARIQEARANLGVASGELYPGVDAVGTIERSRISEGVSELDPAPPQSRTDTFFAAGLDATWEIDFWGRIRRGIESADASIGASIENYRDALVILYANLATAYVDIRTFQARIASTEGNIKAQRGALRLTINRNRAGLAPDLDVRQAELNLATTEAFLPSLRSALAASINRVAVLLGEYPSDLRDELAAPEPIPHPPDEVLVSLPTDLLRQRPDIRSAERQLAAQTAQIGVATADLYPSFSLSGTFALEAFSASNFLEWNSRSFSFGPSVRWNIFDAGRIRSNIAVQDALTQQALVSYEQTVLSAVEEVESAMTAYVEERVRRDALERSVVAARQAVSLVDTLYRTGLTDFQNVLDTQRSQFQQEDALAESEGLVTQNLIRIYRALGGGWAPAATESPGGATPAEGDGSVPAATPVAGS